LFVQVENALHWHPFLAFGRMGQWPLKPRSISVIMVCTPLPEKTFT